MVIIAAVMCFTFLLMTSLVVLTSAQGNNPTPEDAFRSKADKMLQMVRDAAIEDRSNARLTAKKSHVDRLSRIMGVQRLSDSRVMVEVAVKLTDSKDDQLTANGFPVMSRSGDIATLETEVDRLPELASLAVVDKISAAAKRLPLNDRARQTVGIDNASGQRVVTQTGRGVVIGVIDTGIDFRHLDFTVPGSNGKQTRIKALLDMTVYGSQASSWNYVLPGQSAPIGHLYTEADLNAALQTVKPADQNSDPIKQRDKNGHGTHVAGTAAGNGLSSPTPGTYSGMAPEADLIIVKASRENDGTDGFYSTDIMNAIQFVQQKAAELNEPFVINLSLGGHEGPHDGTSPEERAIDYLVNAGTGRSVCVAAGNDGTRLPHVRATVPAGGDLTFNVYLDKPDFVSFYHANSDRLSVTVTRPDGVTLGPVDYDPNGFSRPGGQASDQFLQVFNANDNKGDSDPANDQPNVFLLFKAESLRGDWTIKFHDMDGQPNQPFDGWAQGNGVMFTNNLERESRLIAIPGTARSAITVGAFVNRATSETIGSAASFSSPGPTADGRQKPEISAPGVYLYSARSTDISTPNFGTIGFGSDALTDTTHYAGLSGTSMATPVTAGTVALILQANPNLNTDQIKAYLQGNSDHDSFDPIGWNAKFGYGKLNVASALEAVAGLRKYVISGHVSVQDTSVVVNLSGSQTRQVHIDGSGFYSFGDLTMGGTYTVEASSPIYTFTPASWTFANVMSNQTIDFAAFRKSYRISGRVVDENGVGLRRVFIGVRQNGQPWTTFATDDNGYYSIDHPPAGMSYTLTPGLPFRTFAPASKTIENLTSDQTVDFVAKVNYKIKGRITDPAGTGVADIKVLVTSPDQSSETVISDGQGFYSFDHAAVGSSILVTPQGNDVFTFAPTSQTVLNVAGDNVANFTAQRLAPRIAFNSPIYTFSEIAQTAIIYVKRIGDTSAAASVDYRTEDTDTFSWGCGEVVKNNHSAFGRCDFVTTVGTLRFEPGEVLKSIQVPFVNDSYAESNETFNLTLSNATGAELTSPSTATVTIYSDEVIDGPNPILGNSFFVRQHYLDFLGREPEVGEPWSGILKNCSDVNNNPACDRITVSSAFFGSPEFKERGAFVINSYEVAFGRLPEYSEFASDLASISGDAARRAAFVDRYATRPEFKSNYEGLNNSDYVAALMGRYGLTRIVTTDPANPDGPTKVTLPINDLINRLNGADGTLTRAQVLRAIVQSEEVQNIEATNVFVAAQYYGYLRRKPDATGFNSWINYLSAHPGDFRTMVNGFVNSDEYRMRFGPKP